ncbi:MAG: IS6 family transposase, partial [Rhizobium sp.]
VGSLQQFVPVFSAVRNDFVPSHQKHSALATHIHQIRAMAHWNAVTCATA